MYDVKQLSDINLAMNHRIQNPIPNFELIVTRLLWEKVETPV